MTQFHKNLKATYTIPITVRKVKNAGKMFVTFEEYQKLYWNDKLSRPRSYHWCPRYFTVAGDKQIGLVNKFLNREVFVIFNK